jgi:hypothetical protein
VRAIRQHDDYSTWAAPATYQIDIPKEFLRNGGEKARPAEENEVGEKEFAEAIRDAFLEHDPSIEDAICARWEAKPVKLSEPRELKYGPNKKAA